MRIPGYCTECHKVKQVRVSGHGLAMMGIRGAAEGVCASCEEEKDTARQERGSH
jgi:hypothetical protein